MYLESIVDSTTLWFDTPILNLTWNNHFNGLRFCGFGFIEYIKILNDRFISEKLKKNGPYWKKVCAISYGGNHCDQAGQYFFNWKNTERRILLPRMIHGRPEWQRMYIPLISTTVIFCVINAAWSPRARIRLKTKIHWCRIIAGDSSIPGLIYTAIFQS